MRTFLKWVARIAGGLLVVAVAVFAFGWFKSSSGLERRYVVNDPPLAMRRDAATLERGGHLFATRGCADCHGSNFAGQHVPGTPPSFPDSRNLTPTGLGSWTAADFRRALHEGKRPDGSAIDPFMPWQAYSKMTHVEIDAMWAFLQTLPATPTGK